MIFWKAWGSAPPDAVTSNDSAFAKNLESLTPLLMDDTIDEIWLNHGRRIYARNHGRDIVTLDVSWSGEQLLDFIADLAELTPVRLDPLHPYGGGVLPGYPWRWHASIPPLSPDGPRVSFRRQRFDRLSAGDFFCDNFSFSDLANHIKAGVSLLFFGATGSGKTSLMVSVLRDCFYSFRIGIAETVVEVPLLSPYWFRLTEVSEDTGRRGGVGFSRVVAELMRATPDFIVLGEIRGSEASYLGELARSGHGGVFSTIHAGSFDEALARVLSLSGPKSHALPPIAGIHVRRLNAGGFQASFAGLRS